MQAVATLPLELVMTNAIVNSYKNETSPAKNFRTKVLKRGLSKALGEYIPKLLFCINLQKLNTPFMNLLSNSNSLDRVILTSRGELWWQRLGQTNAPELSS